MGVLISALYFPVSSVIRLSEKAEGKSEFLNIKIQVGARGGLFYISCMALSFLLSEDKTQLVKFTQ